jgi:hypothetical protein
MVDIDVTMAHFYLVVVDVPNDYKAHGSHDI